GFDVEAENGVVSGGALFKVATWTGVNVWSETVDSLIVRDHVYLKWTAPADGPCGEQANRYEIRYAATPITEANYKLATVLPNTLTPKAGGSAEAFAIPALPTGHYYFAIQAVDAAGNKAPLSNVVEVSLQDVPAGH